jgi:hypothetical protein
MAQQKTGQAGSPRSVRVHRAGTAEHTPCVLRDAAIVAGGLRLAFTKLAAALVESLDSLLVFITKCQNGIRELILVTAEVAVGGRGRGKAQARVAMIRVAASTAAARRCAMRAGSAVTAWGSGQCAQARPIPKSMTSRSTGCHALST